VRAGGRPSGVFAGNRGYSPGTAAGIPRPKQGPAKKAGELGTQLGLERISTGQRHSGPRPRAIYVMDSGPRPAAVRGKVEPDPLPVRPTVIGTGAFPAGALFDQDATGMPRPAGGEEVASAFQPWTLPRHQPEIGNHGQGAVASKVLPRLSPRARPLRMATLAELPRYTIRAGGSCFRGGTGIALPDRMPRGAGVTVRLSAG